jgi:segregation and condensation protein B
LEQIFALVKEETRAELARQQQIEAAAKAEVVIVQVEEGAEAAVVEAPVAEPEPGAESGISDGVQDEPSDTDTAAPESGEPEQQAEPSGPEPITDAEVKSAVRAALEELMTDYSSPEHGIEVRQIAGGYRMATKPEQHDVVRAFAKSLKPPIRLSLQALETLAVIAYKQPITAPEISEVRGVDAGGVVGTLLERKLITTSGRKQVIGRPILYKTTKEFLLRFGLKDVGELPSMEEFEKLAAESLGGDLFAGTEGASEQQAEGASKEPASGQAAPAEAEAEPASEEQPAVAEAAAEGDDSAANAEPAAETPEAPEPQAAENSPAEEAATKEEAVPQTE